MLKTISMLFPKRSPFFFVPCRAHKTVSITAQVHKQVKQTRKSLQERPQSQDCNERSQKGHSEFGPACAYLSLPCHPDLPLWPWSLPLCKKAHQVDLLCNVCAFVQMLQKQTKEVCQSRWWTIKPMLYRYRAVCPHLKTVTHTFSGKHLSACKFWLEPKKVTTVIKWAECHEVQRTLIFWGGAREQNCNPLKSFLLFLQCPNTKIWSPSSIETKSVKTPSFETEQLPLPEIGRMCPHQHPGSCPVLSRVVSPSHSFPNSG